MSRNPVTEVARNVYCVAVGLGAFVGVYPPNVYLVLGDTQAVFIDTAYGKDEEVKAQLDLWDEKGRPPVAAVILTHRHGDHIGGAVRLHKATGGPIASSSVEKSHIDESFSGSQVSLTVSSGDTMDLGGTTLEFIDSPGHTLGSLCIHHREEKLLFAGDNILGTGSTVIQPEQGDLTLYLDSLRRLLDFDASLICPGHGPMVHTPQAKIQGLIDHRLQREQQVLDLLRDGRSSVEELLAAIYPELDGRLRELARAQIRSHLVKLEHERRAVALADGVFAPADADARS